MGSRSCPSRVTPYRSIAGSIGQITSADIGYTLGRTLALAYLEPSIAEGAKVEVTTADGASAVGTVHRAALYDPNRTLVRA